jgi:hypothetical protein
LSASNASFAQFVKYLNTNPKFFYASPEALLVGYGVKERDRAGPSWTAWDVVRTLSPMKTGP